MIWREHRLLISSIDLPINPAPNGRVSHIREAAAVAEAGVLVSMVCAVLSAIRFVPN